MRAVDKMAAGLSFSLRSYALSVRHNLALNFRTSLRNEIKKESLHHVHLPCLPCYCHQSTLTASPEVTVTYESGCPVFSIPLPSRNERCLFTLRPVTNTLSDLYKHLQEEDAGIDRVTAYTTEGNRIAGSTTIGMLVHSDFEITINDKRFSVVVPERETLPLANLQAYEKVKASIAMLYSELNVQDHQIQREQELQSKIEELEAKLLPFEEKCKILSEKASNRTTVLKWLGMGMMGMQFGVLARLTWWEYSWDIMEPVTYFITYGTSLAMYAYYVTTKQEYIFPDVRDRQYLLAFHKNAKKVGVDLVQYNFLREELHQYKYDLKRLRDPLVLQLPVRPVKSDSIKNISELHQ